MPPLITVGIASYNYAVYLRKAFTALSAQTFHDFEILYADDYSTDNSVEIIRQLIHDHPEMKIRLIEGNVNVGVMGNKNRLLDHAQGKYLMLCDADDWMDPDCLKNLADAASSTNADRVIAGFRHVMLNGEVGQEESLPVHPSKWNQFQHHGCLYRTEVYRANKLRFTPEGFPDDFYFIEQFNCYTKTVAWVNKISYNILEHRSSASRTRDKNSPWYYTYLFNNILDLTTRLLPSLTIKDAQELEYLILRIYYANLRENIDIGFSQLKKDYLQMHEKLQQVLPQYLSNSFLKKINQAPARKPTAKLIFLCSLLEKYNVVLPALQFYCFLQQQRNGRN